MKKASWAKKIRKYCEDAGTYAPQYEDVITSLAAILEKRDAADEEYIRLGGKPVIEYTNKGGATNLTKHPALVLWNELNSSALPYWRDLGLTPSAFKKLGDAPKKERVSALAKALESLEG